MTIFVRPRAWWYNKVPLSVATFLLLVDGKPLAPTFLPLLGLIGTVCGVANWGYALNELFDRDEDRRAGRANVAETVGRRGMWSILVLSAATAIALAAASAGIDGALLTGGALLLPLAYSVPPLRIKERGWYGVCSDAAAAHLFPAILAVLIASHQGLRAPTRLLVLTVALWSSATGLRGILSHQLQSEERDLNAGLQTVVHRLGHQRLVSFVVFVLLPLEVLSFAGMLLQADVTVFLELTAGVFVLYEWLKWRLDAFPVLVFNSKGERYIPFVDEGLYKVWAPLALALDAAFSDIAYLALAPLYLLLFWPRVMQEWRQIRVTGAVLYARIASLVARGSGSRG